MSPLALRAELAGLNASAPPQQAHIEGWLLRLSPGRAKRSRCVNALEAGTLPLDELLARCKSSFDAAGLPLIIRVTPFSRPSDIDEQLEAKGYFSFDAADVMVLESLPVVSRGTPRLQPLDAAAYAELVGAMRNSSAIEIAAQAERVAASPVPYQGFALVDTKGTLLACGQLARESTIAGLYDVFTPAELRGQGHAYRLCAALLQQAASDGATEAYLQVGSDNDFAKRLYARLGFRFAYRYHYRSNDPRADA
ncbi:GNAT family N-acetyltransferase [soil metagenome]